MTRTSNVRYLMYLTGQHNVVPELSQVSRLTHVILAFMRPIAFNEVHPTSWPLFTTVDAVRAKFAPDTAVMIGIGGWGDSEGFEMGAANETSRKLFARNIKAMLDSTGADGVDIDWEYPGGNGEDYRVNPNSQKAWEIEAYPKLLAEIRSAIGPTRLMSAAVPALPRDMLAFTETTIPAISSSLDFFNIMTYDMMNRRDNITKHHTGVKLSLEAITAYGERGLSPEKMNLGFAFYIKWFKTDPSGDCSVDPIGCKTVVMEDPVTGADLGQAGAFSWHDAAPASLSTSYQKAMAHGAHDDRGGGQYYWDVTENIWWSWDSPNAIARKFPLIVGPEGLGGVFAWGLGEDAPRFAHLTALTEARDAHQDALLSGPLSSSLLIDEMRLSILLAAVLALVLAWALRSGSAARSADGGG